MRKRRNLFILFFHKVGPPAAPFFGESIAPTVFDKQIAMIKNYYEIIDFSRLWEYNNGQLPAKDLVIITFDDGYKDNYLHAFPVLKKHKVPASVFLATDYIGTNRLLWHDKLSWILYNARSRVSEKSFSGIIPETIKPLVKQFFHSNASSRITCLRLLAAFLKDFSPAEREQILEELKETFSVSHWPKASVMLNWDEIREMSAHGISFGSHTCSHPVLTRITLKEARKEAIESREKIESQIKKQVISFAYPYGGPLDYSPDIACMLRKEGFKYACTTISRQQSLPVEYLWNLPRKGVAASPFLFL